MKRMAAKAEDAVTSPDQAAATAIGEPSATDATWAAMMIPHHRTGIEMAELAVNKAATDGLRRAAAKSKQEQEREMPQLEEIAQAAGKAPMPPEPPVEGMNQLQMEKLQSLSGPEFDRHWITVVSGHHMAAITMTDTALAGGESGPAARLQEKLRSEQLEELRTLSDLFKDLDG